MRRRKFIYDAAKGLIVPAVLGILAPAHAGTQVIIPRTMSLGGGGGGGGGGLNNAALVGSNFAKSVDGSSGTSRALAMPSNVSNGNVVIFGAVSFNTTIGASDLVKSAGTATIGTIVQDEVLQPGGSGYCISIFRVPITGSGSLTLTLNLSGTTFSAVAAAEFTGINATPLDSGGTGNSGTAQTTGGSPFTETSGTITTVGNGLIVSLLTETATGVDWSRSTSGTIIGADSHGTTNTTFCMQFLINNTNSNALTATASGSGVTYLEAHASYKTS